MRKLLYICMMGMVLAVVPVSCVRDVIMDAKEKPQVAVACVLTDDPEQVLRLSFTKGASLSAAPPLTEATAVLYDGKERIGSFRRKEADEWVLAYSALPQHRYRLEVEVPGYDSIWAEQTMPEPAPLLVQTRCELLSCITPWSGPEWDVLYPYYRIWPEGEACPDFESYYVLFPTEDPVWICGMNYNPETGKHEMAEEICTNKMIDDINVIEGKEYVPLRLDVPIPFKLKESIPPLPFADTFYDAHLKELYPILAGAPMRKSFLLIPAQKKQLILFISGSFSGAYSGSGTGIWGELEEMEEGKGYLLVTSVSADYDRYLKDAFQFQEVQKSSDLTSIYLRDNVYSNIHGGVGIFGAKTERMYPWLAAYSYIDTGAPYHTADPPGVIYIDPREPGRTGRGK